MGNHRNVDVDEEGSHRPRANVDVDARLKSSPNANVDVIAALLGGADIDANAVREKGRRPTESLYVGQ